MFSGTNGRFTSGIFAPLRYVLGHLFFRGKHCRALNRVYPVKHGNSRVPDCRVAVLCDNRVVERKRLDFVPAVKGEIFLGSGESNRRGLSAHIGCEDAERVHFSADLLGDDNLCQVYKKRPKLCKQYPKKKLAFYAEMPDGCGYYVEKKSFRDYLHK